MSDNNYILTPDGNFISEDELYHHGVKGMKWGVRKNQSDLINTRYKQKLADRELQELREYDKNPSGLGKSKIATAIRRRQIKSLEKTKKRGQSKIDSLLKELDRKPIIMDEKIPGTKDPMEKLSRKMDEKTEKWTFKLKRPSVIKN